MILVVLDTNILVSSLWNKNGAPARIVRMVLEKQVTPCHDYKIMNEYKQVLRRSKFHFLPSDVDELLEFIQKYGFSVIAEPTEACFSDESDRKFYEVAKMLSAILITGNRKHYPVETFIMTPADFLKNLAAD